MLRTLLASVLSLSLLLPLGVVVVMLLGNLRRRVALSRADGESLWQSVGHRWRVKAVWVVSLARRVGSNETLGKLLQLVSLNPVNARLLVSVEPWRKAVVKVAHSASAPSEAVGM